MDEAKYQQLHDDDAAGHPVTGAFNIDPGLAATEWNALNRPADGGIDAMVRYLATNRNRSNEGADTTASALLGRLQTLSESLPFSDPFFRSPHFVAGGSGANEQIELSSTANTITFGLAHTITALNDKDLIEIMGSSQDDGRQQIVSVVGQVVTVPSINYTETLERAARVFEIQDAKLVTIPQRDAAQMFLAVLLQSSLSGIDFTDTEMANAFTLMEDAAVWKSADTTALKALSLNQQSYASERGFPRLTDDHIRHARTL